MRMYPPLFRYRGHYRADWARRRAWVRALVGLGVLVGVVAGWKW